MQVASTILSVLPSIEEIKNLRPAFIPFLAQVFCDRSCTIEMDELTNRCRTFAEAVVTMVWLVLLAAALEGKSEVTGLDVPKFVLILAGPTIICSICPLLACCIFNSQRVVSDVATLLSSATLFYLACWIASFTLGWYYIVLPVAGVSLACTVLRMISYWMQTKIHGHPARDRHFHTILDGSHEFLCCTTGIHFLWLESLAMEGLVGKRHGIEKGLSKTMGSVNILFCAIGLCTILIQMTPPATFSTMGHIAGLLFMFDTFMIVSIGAVLVVAMWKSLVFSGLLLHILGTLIVVGLLLIALKNVFFREEAQRNGENREPPKLAPLGLTKLMVTGFLAVYISVDSADRSITYWFLAFAAAAILSGLIWRLLTQDHVRKVLENNERIDESATVASYAKTACLYAHTFVAIAAVLLVIEIYNVKQSTGAAAPAPAPAST